MENNDNLATVLVAVDKNVRTFAEDEYLQRK